MLKRLSLTNFRSYSSFDITFESPLTIIIGPNAVGKTNLLESIFLASTTKSFRAHDDELINFGESFYKIRAEYGDRSSEIRYVVENDSHRKIALISDIKRPLSQLLGLNPVTLFEPNDLNLLYSSPSSRRRYLDLVLSQVDKNYLSALQLYRRIIKQRNSLLHQAKRSGSLSGLKDHLFVWDVQMVEPAKKITETRKHFLDSLSTLINTYYQSISGDHTIYKLIYEPSLDLSDADVMTQIDMHHQKDIQAGFTTIGPHRDDFTVERDGKKITEIISRGEMRTFILSLKLAEMDFIEQETKKRPTLLLDDVFSELDSARRGHLLEAIANQQTFLTTTDIDAHTKLDAQMIDLGGVANG